MAKVDHAGEGNAALKLGCLLKDVAYPSAAHDSTRLSFADD